MISVPGKITSVNSNTKKIEVKFELSSEVKFEDLLELQKLIGVRVFADFSDSQQVLDDLDDDEEEGYTVPNDSINHGSDQTSIEEFIQSSEQENKVESDATEFSDEESLTDLAEDADVPTEEIPLPDEQDGPGF